MFWSGIFLRAEFLLLFDLPARNLAGKPKSAKVKWSAVSPGDPVKIIRDSRIHARPDRRAACLQMEIRT